MRKLIAVLGAALLTSVWSQAAVLRVGYEQGPDSQWTATFELDNTGPLQELTGFTVYFSEALFLDLSLAASPATWDSIVVQPDLALMSPGFLDSLASAPEQALQIGQRLGGFTVGFRFLGADAPPMIPFEIVDSQFNVLLAGMTVPIPEPRAAALAGLGLVVVLAAALRRRGVGGAPGPQP